MKKKYPIVLFCCFNFALVFFHLYHKSKLVKLTTAQQSLVAEKKTIIAQKNERQLALERLRNPTLLAQEAKKMSMEKMRLSKITSLQRNEPDAFPTL